MHLRPDRQGSMNEQNVQNNHQLIANVLLKEAINRGGHNENSRTCRTRADALTMIREMKIVSRNLQFPKRPKQPRLG